MVVSGIDSQWDVDLIDMMQYKKSNSDYKHILVATDILSHYAWTRALKVWSTVKIRGTRVPQNAIVPVGRPRPYSRIILNMRFIP